MDPLQTTYSENMPAYVEGMVANSEKSNIISRVVEEAAGIGFGKAVMRGTADNQAKAAEAGAKFLGFSVRDTTQLQDSYPDKADMQVLTMGVIVVTASEAVAAGDPVYWADADGALGKTSGAGLNQIAGAVWDSSAGVGELAKVRLGL